MFAYTLLPNEVRTRRRDGHAAQRSRCGIERCVRPRSERVPGRRLKTTARRARGWIVEAFPKCAEAVVAKDDGELELAIAAPRSSKAKHLVLFTWKGQLWVRLAVPNACYPVDDAAELRRVVDLIQKERVVFAVTYSGDAWSGTTLLPVRRPPELAPGETAHLISWSGRHDSILEATPATVSRARLNHAR